MYLFSLIIISLGLLGCSSKEALVLQKSYKEQISYYKALQKTEKIQLYQDNETKIMFTATYLYKPSLENNNSLENFIIGVHYEDNSTKDYSLSLNGQKALKTQILAYTDKRLKDISFVSEWGEYSLVSFPHNEAKKEILTIQSPSYGTASLYFSKVAKYIFENK